ncbi:MAG: hypothetical protein AVDCRST_MAG93-8798, partial [uncultured Chloroflexia bacterium]
CCWTCWAFFRRRSGSDHHPQSSRVRLNVRFHSLRTSSAG